MLTWIQKTPNIEFETIEEAATLMSYKYNDATQTTRRTWDTYFEQFSSYELDNYILQYKQRVAGTTNAREYTYWFIPLLHWIIRKQLGLSVYKNSSIDMGELVIYTSGGATSYYYPCAYRTEQQAKQAIDDTIALGVVGLDYTTIEEITRDSTTFYTIPVIYPFYNFTALISGSLSTNEYILPTIWSGSGYIDYDPDTGYDLTLDNIDLPTQRGGGWLAYTAFNNFYILEGTFKMLSVLGTGLLNAYKISNTSLNILARDLWDTSFIEQITKSQADIYDAIVKLMILPCGVGNTTLRSFVKLGNKNSSTLPAYELNEQYISFNLGQYAIEETHDNYLDYAGFTRISIFLPFIGWRNLDTNEVMGKTISVVYTVDCITGACMAKIIVDNLILYNFTGTLGYEIPITGTSAPSLFSGILQSVTGGVTMLGGAAMAATGNVPGAAAAAAAVGGASGMIGGAMNAQKLDVVRTGSVSGNLGYFGDLGEYTPILMIKRPIDYTPSGYNYDVGFQTYDRGVLSSFTGFVKSVSFDLDNVIATKEEIKEIEQLLKEGVFI